MRFHRPVVEKAVNKPAGQHSGATRSLENQTSFAASGNGKNEQAGDENLLYAVHKRRASLSTFADHYFDEDFS